MASYPADQSLIKLRKRVVCPHCWESFPPENSLWIAQHPELRGDARLGPDQSRRFLPTRFSIDGAALDEKGFKCHELACPRCHLPFPRSLTETDAFFLSILGAPASGKSYFLASMTWRLRTQLPQKFAISISDADPLLNYRLIEYESLQFLNPDPDTPVLIEKTQTQGDLYNTVIFGDQQISYLRPFIFMLQATEGHPSVAHGSSATGALCLYDNAGESFLPGQDTASNPVTRHLARSGAIFFTFDPTQDVRFRRACAGHTADIQMMERTERSQRENSVRQETILVEAAQRVRRYAGLSHAAKHHRPLIVIVTKYDAWAPLLGPGSLPRFWHANSSGTLCAVRHDMIEGVSRKLRELLRCLSPEIVAAAEGFASEVIYVPVSATGCGPELAPGMKTPGFRPRNIRPLWAEVPMIYTMSRWMSGFVYFVGPSPGQSTAAAAPPALPGGNGAAATQRSPSRVFGATLNGDSV